MRARLTRWLGIGVLGIAGQAIVLADTASPPARVLDELTSESYPARVQARAELSEWARTHGEEALDWLLGTIDGHRDPEVRGSAFEVLRERVLEDLESERPGFIGITMLGVAVEFEGETLPAIRITSVQADSPGKRAGLREGDRIIALDGERWQGGDVPEQLALKVGRMKPGREVRLTVLRDGEPFETVLELAPRPWAAGEWGDFQRMRMDPFAGRGPLGLGQLEEEAREEAFLRWLEERLALPGPR